MIMNRTIVTTVVLGLIVGASAVALVRTQQAEHAAALSVYVTETRERLEAIAAASGRNEVHPTATGIVQNCAGRAEYLALLAQLDTLASSELGELAALQSACEPFSSSQKALNVYGLETALHELENYLTLAGTIEDRESVLFLERWEAFIEMERTRGALLARQYALQGDIITALQAGDSAAVEAHAQAAQEVNEQLTVLSLQINSERGALTEL